MTAAAAAPAIAARLRKLVYWSAVVPAAGRSLHDEVPPHYQEMSASLAQASGNNSVAMPFESWQAAFMTHAAEEAQRIPTLAAQLSRRRSGALRP